MSNDEQYERQLEIFERLYNKITRMLRRIGRPDSLLGLEDYSVYDGYWGHPQVKISIGKLDLLRPQVVKSLQKILSEFPGWEIIVAVANLETGKTWPDMGLIVRHHEIVDGLQRQYFPKEFQDIRYPGSRPGTERD